jgi:hypothetical protein
MAIALTDLVVTEDALAQEELAPVLGPYLNFTNSGQILPTERFAGLPAEEQVLCVLLGLQALRILGLRSAEDASPAEIAELSGMSPGTVRPKLRSLLKQRRVSGASGRYTLPLHAARRAANLLSERNG